MYDLCPFCGEQIKTYINDDGYSINYCVCKKWNTYNALKDEIEYKEKELLSKKAQLEALRGASIIGQLEAEKRNYVSL